MSLAHDLAARALHLLDPEEGHGLAVRGLGLGLGPRAQADRHAMLAVTIAGLELPNPVGLAAGFDKNARAIDGALQAGFGFVEAGTVTPLPQAGNPRPRLFRLPEDRGVINRMGFNNDGLEGFVARLSARKRAGVVGANVGANKDSADRVGDYVTGLRATWRDADYVTANISSPNTPGLRGLQEKRALTDMLGRLAEARSELTRTHGARPLFLKVAPDLDDSAIADIAEIVMTFGIDAVIVSNTTIDRPASLRGRHRSEAGGLSGRPLFQRSNLALRVLADVLGGRLPLIGAGGVEDGGTALAKIRAGASAIQLYSALVYEGPGLVARIQRDLVARLQAEGFASLTDAIGADRR